MASLAAAPVAVVRGAQDRPLQTVRIVEREGEDGVAARIAAALPGRAERVSRDALPGELEARDVAIAAIDGWEALAGPAPPDDAGLVLVTTAAGRASADPFPARPAAGPAPPPRSSS